MLVIDVVTKESYDETTEKFVKEDCVRIELEHSLVSLSKWESVFEKPFLSKEQRTDEETIAYIEMMIVGPKPSPEVFYQLLTNHVDEIKEYVGGKKTGTTIPKGPGTSTYRETISSELIYYWMDSLNIRSDAQHWHLNRLFTLIQVHAVKNSPKRKMSPEERRALNKQRQAQYNTRG
jgi:hypothetical protein